jgi:FtsP/CotA-like multicopper oxidase with cupredoxin domain
MKLSERVSRRQALQLAGLGLAGLALGPVPLARALSPVKLLRSETVRLSMRACLAEMVDETPVFMWAFEHDELGLHVPGPVIYVCEGDEVDLEIRNLLPHPHRVSVPGVATSGLIGPGDVGTLAFRAPAPGTYLYLDPEYGPVSRLMGLVGILVVMPTDLRTPYGPPTGRVGMLFRDLGTTEHFPGESWDPRRTWIWAVSAVDPKKHAWVAELPAGQVPDTAAFVGGYTPCYFMINGKSGYFAGHDPSIAPEGEVGQPALIRTVNTGPAFHSLHIHGNHVHVLAVDGEIQPNVLAVDTWALPPAGRVDVLLPYIAPPDAYPWPPSDPKEFGDLAETGDHGMLFPMHCHTEMSQTAAGGNYPQGLVTHWAITGDRIHQRPRRR